ncbi:MAG: hypothetical protein PHF67_04275 [Candidatus Nanoarchaeia archaeon]|nr:hypothetical protein [Candidatus Nanoarchaeia archaeon]
MKPHERKRNRRINEVNQMFASLALTEPITQVGFIPVLLRMTQQITRETGPQKAEQGGYFGGVVKNGVFCIFDNHCRGFNLGSHVTFDNFVPLLEIEIFKRIIEKIPAYRTVIYHNHPRASRQTLEESFGRDAKTYIDVFRRGLESGIYEVLGITDLDESINEEVSRQISDQDIRNTPGRYNLVISPTFREGNPFSHLNFYDLKTGSLFPGLVPVTKIPESKVKRELKIRLEAPDKIYQEHFGSSDLLDLTEEGYRRAFLTMHGLDYKDFESK